MDTKKASLATLNQIKLYMKDKRRDSEYFQKPNLYKEWFNKQQDKRVSMISQIDNRRISNDFNN